MWLKTAPNNHVALSIDTDQLICITINHHNKPTAHAFQIIEIPEQYRINHSTIAQTWLLQTIQNYCKQHKVPSYSLSITLGGHDIVQQQFMHASDSLLDEQAVALKGTQHEHLVTEQSDQYMHTINAIPHNVICKYQLLAATIRAPILFIGTQLQAALTLSKKPAINSTNSSIADLCSHVNTHQLAQQFNYHIQDTSTHQNQFKLAIGTYYLGI